MGKACRVKQRTKTYKKRKRFCRKEEEGVDIVNELANNVNMDNKPS